MEFFGDILGMFSTAYLYSFVNFLFWIVILLVGLQYRRMVRMEVKMFGVPKNNVVKQTLLSAGFGIIGGVLASLLLIIIGISLEQVGIIYLWPLAILLMLVNPRYMCFAYAGGIIGVTSTILTFFSSHVPENSFFEGLMNINVPGLMALIGILHLTESFLIALSGHMGPSPLFIKNSDGRIVGGFSLQKFWPLPIIGLITLMVPEAVELMQYGMEMPNWWPLIGDQLPVEEGKRAVFLMLPVVAGLGYGDFSIATWPRGKTLHSAKNLGWYSIVLIILAISAHFMLELAILAVLFAPLGHEYLIIKGNKDEFSKTPIFVPPEKGVKILDVLPGYPAHKGGLASGDVVLQINGCDIDTRADLNQCIQSEESDFTLKVKESSGNLVNYRITITSRPKKLGVILVPDIETTSYVEIKQYGFIQSLKRKFARGKH